MSEPLQIACAYIDAWNETDAQKRQALLQTTWTPDATYVDPLAAGRGLAEINDLIGGVQARFPDFRFTLLGSANGHGDHVRFSWALGPEGGDAPIKGTDFALLQDGRIRAVTGFLDQVPLGAA